MSDGEIHIVGWEKFQHGATRDNPWIKDYTSQLHKDEYLDLSFHLRGVLQGLRLAYATSHRQLRDNTATLQRHLGHRVLRRDIERLCDAGFIEVRASTTLAQSREEESREEKTPPTPPQRAKPAPPATPSAEIAVRSRDVVWDFVVELSGEPLPGRRAGHGRMTSDLRTLLERTLNGRSTDNAACAAELRRRHEALAVEFGDAKATARALVTHWDRAGKMADGLMRPPQQRRAPGIADRLMAHSLQLRQEEP